MQEPPQTAPGGLPLGVNLAGYLDSVLGVGQVARQVRSALESAGVAVAPFTVVADSAPRIRGGEPERAAGDLHPVNLVCVNPDGLEGAHDSLGEEFFAGRHTIGLWWWEVDAFPDAFRRAFDLVDEVWVGSHHVADALAAVSPVPVVRMPVPVEPEPSSGAGREQLGLPAGRPLFLFAFDHGGGFQRKNPLGAIEAFTRAFGPDDGPQLVVKCIGAQERPEAHGWLLEAAATHDHIHVLDDSLPPPDMAALMEACDAYVSLHRSEGFGLTIAEAMLRAKPVVATAYSGPRDWLSERNCFEVDWREVPIGPGNEPYPAEGTWAEPDLDDAAAQLRRVVNEPDEARRRAERGRDDVRSAFSAEAAGRAMAARLTRVAGLPLGGNGDRSSLDVGEALRRVRGAPPEPGPDASLRPLRMPLRRALLRLSRPQATHQRLVDEELVRLVQTLDERVEGLAKGQSSLRAELEDIKRQLDR
jgi:glycosyltransferase involved in cell wall biosynthesis